MPAPGQKWPLVRSSMMISLWPEIKSPQAWSTLASMADGSWNILDPPQVPQEKRANIRNYIRLLVMLFNKNSYLNKYETEHEDAC